MEKSTKSILVLLGLTVLTACQSESSAPPRAVSAGALTREYQESSASVRSKYDGKEITVRGFARSAARAPRSGDGQGSVLLEEAGPEKSPQLACWFSKERAAEFSQISGGQYITVKGIFNGEVAAELKFCRLVRVE